MRWGQSFLPEETACTKAQRCERGRYTLRDPSTKGEGGDTQPTRMEEAEARTHWPETSIHQRLHRGEPTIREEPRRL